MKSRLKIRLPDADEILIDELILTASDRIKLRVGSREKELPTELHSICIEVVTAMYRRHEMQHEGVESEGVDVFSVKFVNKLLDEYEEEFQAYKNMRDDEEDNTRGVVRFL